MLNKIIDEFNLKIEMVEENNKVTFIGELLKDNKRLEYCVIRNLPNDEDTKLIYDILVENEVFPNHFYNIIDDFYYSRLK